MNLSSLILTFSKLISKKIKSLNYLNILILRLLYSTFTPLLRVLLHNMLIQYIIITYNRDAKTNNTLNALASILTVAV